jgi:hypothetical protein
MIKENPHFNKRFLKHTIKHSPRYENIQKHLKDASLNGYFNTKTSKYFFPYSSKHDDVMIMKTGMFVKKILNKKIYYFLNEDYWKKFYIGKIKKINFK